MYDLGLTTGQKALVLLVLVLAFVVPPLWRHSAKQWEMAKQKALRRIAREDAMAAAQGAKKRS